MPNILGKSRAGSPVLESSHRSKSQYVQCQMEANINSPLNTMCAAATPSKLQNPGSTPVAPVISHPFQLLVMPKSRHERHNVHSLSPHWIENSIRRIKNG